jgi:hypothetical protein
MNPMLAATLGLTLMAAPAPALDGARLEELLGRKGVAQAGEFKASVPHSELGVKVDGFSIVPDMGVTSWVAFAPHGAQAMAMGDLVLLEDEVKAVQRAALAEGLSVTALHNHFLRDAPKVMYMHVGGMGDPEKLARSLRRVLDRQRELREAKKLPLGPAAVESSFDLQAVDAILGHGGKMKNGVYKVVIGRPDVSLKDAGAPVSAFLGFNTWMAFQGTRERAAVAGDFAMLAGEVESVIRELVGHGIEVAAIHNHMTAEEPRIFFLHFWGVGTPTDLARGLRAALDRTGKR